MFKFPCFLAIILVVAVFMFSCTSVKTPPKKVSTIINSSATSLDSDFLLAGDAIENGEAEKYSMHTEKSIYPYIFLTREGGQAQAILDSVKIRFNITKAVLVIPSKDIYYFKFIADWDYVSMDIYSTVINKCELEFFKVNDKQLYFVSRRNHIEIIFFCKSPEKAEELAEKISW